MPEQVGGSICTVFPSQALSLSASILPSSHTRFALEYLLIQATRHGDFWPSLTIDRSDHRAAWLYPQVLRRVSSTVTLYQSPLLIQLPIPI